MSRDSLSEFSSIRIDGTEIDNPDLLSCSAPNPGYLSNAQRGFKREAIESIDQPTTRKRTFSNAGPINLPANASSSTSEKRTATKICRVCGDKAYSYNFNVITCESCKAFFRRNANKEKVSYYTVIFFSTKATFKFFK